VAALFAFASLVVPGATADNLHHKQQVVQKKLATAQTDFDESSKKVRNATEAVLSAEARLSTAQNTLSSTRAKLAAAQALDAQMQTKLNAATARLTQAKSDYADGRQRVADQSQQLAQIAVDHYESGDPSLLGLTAVFSGQDPTDITSQLESMQSVMDKEQSIYDSLQASRIVLQIRKQQVADAEQEVASERKAAAENLDTMQQLEQQAAEQEAQVAQLVVDRQAALDSAQQAKKAAKRQIAKFKKEREKIKKMIERRTRTTNGSYNGPGGGNGFFDMPVNGPITSPYGWRIHPIWGYYSLHDGIDIGAACGTPIRAPAAGKVVSEYYNVAWGNRLFLSHGIHYGVGLSTIYNHLSKYAVHVGQTVQRGQIIGYVGTTGWSTGCHLHWTVMENGQTVDPMKWL
jgi:murein DD-endopeptidase MepM/ murein hydrolase activator NlpD